MAVERALIKKGITGRIGGVTYYQQDGITLSRQSSSDIPASQSVPQMIQRVKMLNLINFYNGASSWAKRLFPLKKALLTSPNEFQAMNIANNRIPLSKEKYALGIFYTCDYFVSHGILQTITGIPLYANNLNLAYGYTTRLRVSPNFDVDAHSWLDTSEELLRCNSYLQKGDTLTFVLSGPADADNLHITRAYQVRIGVESEDYFPFLFHTLPMGSASAALGVVFMQIQSVGDFKEVYGFACILSRMTRRGFQCSTERMICAFPLVLTSKASSSEWASAISSYNGMTYAEIYAQLQDAELAAKISNEIYRVPVALRLQSVNTSVESKVFSWLEAVNKVPSIGMMMAEIGILNGLVITVNYTLSIKPTRVVIHLVNGWAVNCIISDWDGSSTIRYTTVFSFAVLATASYFNYSIAYFEVITEDGGSYILNYRT